MHKVLQILCSSPPSCGSCSLSSPLPIGTSQVCIHIPCAERYCWCMVPFSYMKSDFFWSIAVAVIVEYRGQVASKEKLLVIWAVDNLIGINVRILRHPTPDICPSLC